MYPANNVLMDVVSARDCPAYRAKIDELWSAKLSHIRPRPEPAQVQAGPFAIVDSDNLFDLKNTKGRQAAALWIRNTLAAVRPCWNTIRQDQTREVADDLYRRLSMRLPPAPMLPGSGSAPHGD
jgi:hypothetical protein